MTTPNEPITITAPEPTEPEPQEAAGAEPDESDASTQPQAGTTSDPWADPDAARKEIEKLRRENAASRTKAKDRDTLAAKVAEYERAQLSDQERLQAQLTEAEQRSATLQARTVRAEVRALAANAFADPDDAAAFLALDSYVDAQGEVDTDQIQADLADLLGRKPHLGKAAAAVAPPAEPVSPRRPAPDRTQAAGATPTRTSSAADDVFGDWFQNAAFGR